MLLSKRYRLKRCNWEFGSKLSFTKITVLYIKKELLVLEYIDKVYQLNDYAVTPAIYLTLALYCYILLIN